MSSKTTVFKIRLGRSEVDNFMGALATEVDNFMGALATASRAELRSEQVRQLWVRFMWEKIPRPWFSKTLDLYFSCMKEENWG